MRLYVWRSPWGEWVVSTTRKERYLRGYGRSVYYRPTHAEAFADAWARTHPKTSLVPLGNDTYRVVGAMRRSAVTGRYLTSADKGE